MKLSIIIPAHNEEKRIGKMLDAYLPYFTEKYANDVEFIVAINGTTDATAEVVSSYSKHYPQLRSIIETNNVGKGGGLMLGFAEAKGDLIGFSDADGSTPPEAFQDLIDNIDEADVIIASRWCKGSRVSPHQPLRRRIASRIFNILVRVLFGLKLTDTQCGAKLMRRETIKHVMKNLGITRWAFDVDMLYQLKRDKASIKEIPTVWRDVDGSKLRVVESSVEMFFALVRLRLMYSPFRWVVSLYRPGMFSFKR